MKSFKLLSPLLICLLAVIFSADAQENNNLKFEIEKGTNISHWLSQSKKRGEERRKFFTEKDVQFLAETGFDHIRFPVDEEQLWLENGQKDKEGFDLLHSAIQWCKKYKLKAIVDLHILRSHYFNAKVKPLFTDPKEQERFNQCWRDLSTELNKYPNVDVAYELMNEPVADQAEDWNRIVKGAVATIRSLEPYRIIIIGSNRWQSPDTFDQLYVPPGDKNLILSFHFYSPMLLTHYTASWVKTGGYKGPINYPGELVKASDIEGLNDTLKQEVIKSNKPFTKKNIETIIQKPVDVAKKHGLPLYCGEWGCYKEAPEEARLKWYRDVLEVLKKNNIAWATWDYKGGFGLIKEGKKDEPLIKVLMKR